MFVPILTFMFGAATGGVLVRRGRTPAQVLAAVTGTLLAVYLAMLVGDLLSLYLDYNWSRNWLASHLLLVDPLLLQALAVAMAFLHFAIFPSVFWAFITLQHRRFAILLGALICGSLLVIYLVAPKRFVDTETKQFLYKYSRDAQNCINLYNRELKFDPTTGAELQDANGAIIQEFQRQSPTRSCQVENPIKVPKPPPMPRRVVVQFARPSDDRLKTPPFTLPARNYGILAAEGTNLWSESVLLGGDVALLKLAAQGWNNTAGWVQPVVEESTYLTDQIGNRYRLLSDYGRYADLCVNGDLDLKCHKILPGEVYRFELAFENPADSVRELHLYYTGLNGAADVVAFPVAIGEWRQHPDASPPMQATAVAPLSANPEPVARPPVPEAAPMPPAENPTPSAVLCSTPVVIRSTTLPDNINTPGPGFVRLDWVAARLYLRSGAEPPRYPLSACVQRVSGTAVVDVVAGPEGAVRIVRPVKGQDVFLNAVTQAVRSWRFSPVYEHGQAAVLATRIQFDFGLNE